MRGSETDIILFSLNAPLVGLAAPRHSEAVKAKVAVPSVSILKVED